ncbi:MAG: hypothetical protein ABW069_15590 [Duganella sp.]
MDDPGHVAGTDKQIHSAFDTCHRIIRARIDAFLSLPLDELSHDRARL